MSSLTRRIQRAHGTRSVVIEGETTQVPHRPNPSTSIGRGTSLGQKNPSAKDLMARLNRANKEI